MGGCEHLIFLLVFDCGVDALGLQVILIDPGQFRVINEMLQRECKGRGRIETMSFAATAGS